MLSAKSIKFVNSLRLKKNRNKENLYILEGTKIVYEYIISNLDKVRKVYALADWKDLEGFDIEIDYISERDLKKISSLSTPNKVLAIVQKTEEIIPDSMKGWSVFLDEIQDPGNLGAILRIADWFGIENVFLNKGCVDPYNSKVVQASMGAVFRNKIVNIEFDDLVDRFPDMVRFSADMDGDNIYHMEFPDSGIILIGNEGRGLSQSIIENSTRIISIPRPRNSKGVESLNAAVSTGIIIGQIINS